MTGTPLLSMVPSVRAKRAVSIFMKSGPTSGRPSIVWSHWARPWGLPVHTRHPRRAPRISSTPAHQYPCTPALTQRRIWVGSGIAWPRSAKIVANRGITKVIRKTTAPMPTATRKIG